MAWPAGTRLGPYEILAPLGAGGMGEVYRARDAKLNRDVAIKVLPSPLAEDAEALARFEREARAVAALSHPNILAIFDFQREGAVAYAVTELLEGETLHSRLSTGALPARKTIEYGVQIAQGLAAAHERGIVHRDLKPENVFVTADGRVKILDFGLARQDRPGAGSENTRSPTMTRHTEPGTVMGTVGYMSPEQVRGRAADALSDIFSFGVVLYEMGAGRRAFQRETAAETMTAILKEEPPPIAESGANVPPGFERIVAHCLEKSPQERFQSARDIAFALQELSGQSTPRAGSAALAQKRHVPGGLVLAALGMAALVAAYLAGGRNDHTQPPAFHRLTFRRGIVHAARFAADGRTILYSAAWQGGPSQVYSTRVDGIESRPLDLQGATLLALSQADEIAVARNARVDRSAYWSVMQGTLASAPLSGGAPRDLLQDVAFADFSPDGRTLAIVRGRADKRALESPPGRILYETAGWISEPRLSPRGEGIAFLDHLHATEAGGDVCLIDSGGKKRTLSSGFLRAQGLAWSPNGREVWFTASREGSARALYGVSLTGKERLIYRMPGALTLHDVSRSGRVLLAREEIRRESRARAPGDAQEKDVSWLDYSNLINISSDGTTIAFVEMGDGGGPGSTTYVRRLDGSAATLVVAGANALDLSPDGQWLLSMEGSDSAHPELRLVPTGPGEPKVLKTLPMEYDYAFLSPDGKKVFTTARTAGQGARTYVQEISGGPPRPVAPEGLATSLLDNSGTDGDSIVVRNGAGDALLWSLSAGRGRPIPGFDSHSEMAIGFGARGVLYVSPVDGLPRPVFRLDTTTGARQRVLDLLPADPTGVSEVDIAALTPDASAYAYSYIRRSCDLYVVDGLK